VLGRTVLDHVLELVEELTLGTIATASAVIDIRTADVGHMVAQARYTVLSEVQTVGSLPGTLILGIEVGPVGVGQPEGGAAVTFEAFTLIDAIVIAHVAAAALVRQSEGMGSGGVSGRQAPGGVLAFFRIELTLLLGAVAVEIQGQRVAAI